MQSKTALTALLALLCVGALGWMFWGGANAANVAEWDQGDEVEIEEGEENFDDELSSEDARDEERAEFQGAAGAFAEDPDASRPLITVKGRVVDKHKDPVARAKVILSAQGRGRRNRIKKEVITERDGTFAFQGKGFARLWISLQVTHENYAPATAFKPFENAKGVLDMGDIKVVGGGSIVGSITDMQGNIVPDAEASLQPDGRGRWRRLGREASPVVKTDGNGTFRIEHVAPGRYRISATAPHRQRKSDGPITVIDGQEERLDPIQLGPGFELTGIVFEPDGSALANADVSIRGNDRRSREQNRRTNKQGQFAFDHLAPGKYSVQTRADGYLTNRVAGIEVTKAPPLTIHLEAGLAIAGVVSDGPTGQPVLRYGAKIRRVGGLPDPEGDRRRAEGRRLMEEIQKLRDKVGNSPETRKKIEGEIRKKIAGLGFGGRDGMRQLRSTGRGGDRGRRGGGDRGRRGGDRGRGDRGGDRGRGGFGRGFGRGGESGRGRRGRGSRNANLPGDTGEIAPHADGKFRFDGLEEGIYVVDIGSPDHTKLRSQRVELRKGVAPPHLNLVAQRGFAVAGMVFAKLSKAALRRVTVELRLVTEDEGSRRSDNNRGNRSRDSDGGVRNHWRNMMERAGGNNGPRTARLLSARTNHDGTFKIVNAPAGKFVLRAEAEGFTTESTAVFELSADKPGFELSLGALGILRGRVSGVAARERTEVTVMAFSMPFNFRQAKVQPDGSYEITGLDPGGYFVRAFMGDSRRYLMREMFSGMGGGPNAATPQVDVKVKEGGEHKLDLAVTHDPTGSVRGKVMVNGKGAKGYRVALRKVETNNGSESSGGFGGRFGRFGGFGRNSGTVDQNGDYEINGIDAGQYDLTVSRGGRGGNELNRQRIYVAANNVNQVPVMTIYIGSLRGTVSVPAAESGEKKPARGGRVTLYKDVVEVPDPKVAGGESVLRFSERVRDNKFAFKNIPSGNYLLQLRFAGRETATQNVYVGGDENKAIELTAGPVRKKKTKKKSAAPKTK